MPSEPRPADLRQATDVALPLHPRLVAERLGRPSRAGSQLAGVQLAGFQLSGFQLVRALFAGACVAALPACQAPAGEARRDAIDEVQELSMHQRYEEALQRADELVQANGEDPELAALRNDAATGVILERARRLSFENEDELALVQVEAALERNPESEQAIAWRERLVEKLSERWFQRGREAHAKGEYEAADIGYRKSLEYLPTHPLASTELENLRTYLGWRQLQSDEYYNDGVRAFAGARLSEARSGFESSRKYEDGEVARTERRIKEVQREAALSSKHIAEVQAEAGYWLSAKRSMDEALALNPALEGGAELRDVYDREAHVSDLRREAEVARLRGKHDRARELLADAATATKFQAEAVTSELALVDESEAEAMYQGALDLEYDFRFVEAVAKYRELLSKRDFYLDARARLGTLEDAIQQAAALYEQAAKAKTDAEKTNLYRQIELVWPEYRDVRARLDALGAAR
ncbi:MAG: hypothetical protein R3F49_23410 [Planctomycetota bacterium]